MDTLPLLRMENKTPMEGVTETKFGAETKGWTIQRLSIWIQKMWYIYTMEYYSAIKNNTFMKFLDKWMDLEDIILSEVTQSQKNTH